MPYIPIVSPITEDIEARKLRKNVDVIHRSAIRKVDTAAKIIIAAPNRIMRSGVILNLIYTASIRLSVGPP